MRCLRWFPLILLGLAAPAAAQMANAARAAVLAAEDRRAATPADLTRLRTGALGGDPQTARLAVRALGRLERPALIPDILPVLNSRFADVRTEAAYAVAHAAAGLRRGAAGGPAPDTLLPVLRARLVAEEDAGVRAALAESLARLPYADPASSATVQQVLVELAASHGDVADRLGVARALEAFVRMQKGVTLEAPALTLLRSLVGVVSTTHVEPLGGTPPTRTGVRQMEPSRDARVRRLAMEALITAGAADATVVERGLADADVQVRRLAVRAAARARTPAIVTRALEDASPMVRLEAVRGLATLTTDDVCAWTLAAAGDADIHVVLQAIDQLKDCGRWDQAVSRLADLAADATAMKTPRGWHQPSHALVALAAAAPDRAATALPAHTAARNPFVRVYAARAAAAANDRATLVRLAADADDNVAEAAIEGLMVVAGGTAATTYVSALARKGYQAVRAAARALEACASCPDQPAIGAALRAAHERLTTDGHDNSTDARTAIAKTLVAIGAPLSSVSDNRSGGGRGAARTAAGPAAAGPFVDPTIDELQRLAAPRARITIRDVGVIDVALITVEAPLTVVHVARLAERGYYNGLTIHRVAANFVLQGGSPDANEYVGHPDYMRDEVGSWPHVRGALGISTRGRDTGDAQFFIDLVDNPRLDHEYTAFGQVITGIEVADRVLEGDVIESVQILAN